MTFQINQSGEHRPTLKAERVSMAVASRANAVDAPLRAANSGIVKRRRGRQI